MIDTDQSKVPCAILRGGTSRAIFFRSDVMPKSQDDIDLLILDAIGSGDPREIDGLGGADQLTSKVAIVGPSKLIDADVDFTFCQVGIDTRLADYFGTCGNISAAVGVFAVEENFVRLVEPVTNVRIFNTNTKAYFSVRVPVLDGALRSEGDFAISGVPGTGAELRLDFASMVGTLGGKLLPTGSPKDSIFVPELRRAIDVSIVDLAKPAAFFDMGEIGLSPLTPPPEVATDVLNLFLAIQTAVAGFINIDPKLGLPRPAALAAAESYRNYMTGEVVEASDMDFVGRWVGSLAPPIRVRKAYSGSGGVCTAVAALLPGTVVHDICRPLGSDLVRIGHPSGVLPVHAQIEGDQVVEAAISRTARRIADGQVFVPALSGT